MRLKALYEECGLFEKKAQKVSVVENTEPFLQELSKIKDFDKRIEFAEKHCKKKLGEGSSRVCFQLNDEFIMKVSFNEKGCAQSKTEMKPVVQRDCVNAALVADPDGKWIIFHMTQPLTEKKFKEIMGYSFTEFTNSLFYKFNQESDKWKKPKKYDEITENAFYCCIASLVYSADLLIGDLSKISSWKLKDGKVVLTDAGLDRDTYAAHYERETSSGNKTSVKSSE